MVLWDQNLTFTMVFLCFSSLTFTINLFRSSQAYSCHNQNTGLFSIFPTRSISPLPLILVSHKVLGQRQTTVKFYRTNQFKRLRNYIARSVSVMTLILCQYIFLLISFLIVETLNIHNLREKRIN